MEPKNSHTPKQYGSPIRSKPSPLAEGLRFINSEEKPRNINIIEEILGDSMQSDIPFIYHSKEGCSFQNQDFYSYYSEQHCVEESQGNSVSQEKCRTVKKQSKPLDQQKEPTTAITARKNVKGCKCGNSKCQKGYCVCFKNGNICSSDCNCIDCQNLKITDEHIKNQRIVKEMLQNQSQLGCKCKNSNCLKKYCVCHSNGKKCSDECRCINCHNMQGTEKGRFEDKSEVVRLDFTARKRVKISEFEYEDNKENIDFNI